MTCRYTTDPPHCHLFIFPLHAYIYNIQYDIIYTYKHKCTQSWKMVTLIQVALSFCFTKLTLNYWSWWSIHTVGQQCETVVTMDWWFHEQDKSLLHHLSFHTYWTSLHLSSSVMMHLQLYVLLEIIPHFSIHYAIITIRTYLRPIASTFSYYCIKFLETGIKLSNYPINMLTVQGHRFIGTLSPWLLVT